MPPEVAEAIAAFLVINSLGILVLIGMKMRYNARRNSTEDREAIQRLTELVEGFHDEFRAVREDMLELNERVDFTERVLTRGHPGPALEESANTPV